MTTRISRRIPALVVIACTACSTAVAAPTVVPDSELSKTTHVVVEETSPDIEALVALADDSGRLLVLASGTQYDEALLSADGRRAVVVARPSPGTTWLGWVDTVTGDVIGATELTGDLDAVATDPEARFVGLVAAGGERHPDAIAIGRTSTEVVVASVEGEVFRRRLSGNLVPEAFSEWTTPHGSGPGSAYVIDYQPAEHPTHYRVRVLDLATGVLGLPVNLRDKVQPVDQLMAGISRTSIVAADDGLLFTLYRGHHDEGTGPYAFIHTLAFGNGVWCLEVPTEMELAERSGALVMSPDGDHLVAVSANGTTAQIAISDILDPEAMPVFDVPTSLGATAEGVPAVASGADVIAVGLGSTMVLVDPVDLSVLASRALPIAVESLALTDAGFIAAGDGRLLQLDESLTVVADAMVPNGLARIRAGRRSLTVRITGPGTRVCDDGFVAADPPVPGERSGRHRRWWLVAAVLLVGGGVCAWLVVDAPAGAEPDGALVATTSPSTTVVASTTTTTPASTTIPAPTTTPAPTIATTIRGGSVGTDVAMVQRRLDELGFPVGDVDGRFGPRTEQAVWAFKKLVLGATPAEIASDPMASDVTPDVWASLRDATPISPRRELDGTHVEVYLREQVLAVFVDGRAQLVAHISSGNGERWCEEITYDTGAEAEVLDPAVTRRECGVGRTPGGSFAVTATYDGVRNTPIGAMIDPVFFNHTIAIHGLARVPGSPSTRGGIGIAEPLAATVSEMLEPGDKVLVWGEQGREPESFTADESLPAFNTLDPECIIGLYVLKEGDTRALVAARFDITEVDLNGANVATDGYLEFLPGLQVIIPPRDCPAATPSTEA